MRKTTITTDKNNFVFPPRKPRSDRGDVVFTSCSRCFPIDTQAIRNKILDLAIRGKLTEQLPEDGSAEELYRQIQAEKQALVKAGKIKKENPLSEITVDEEPFGIPENWYACHVSDINFFVPETTNPLNNPETVYELFSVPVFFTGQPEILKGERIASTKQLLQENDVLVCKINPRINRVWRVTKHTDFTLIGSSEWIPFRNSKLDAQYMCYYFQSPFFRLYMLSNLTGVGGSLTRAKPEKFKRYPVFLPPLAEQHRIVEKIDQAFSILDTIDALQAQYADNLTVLKSKLIDAAIQGKLTEQLPEDGTAEELYQQIQAVKKALIKAGKIRKEKPLPEITEAEIPFEIPANWKWVRLSSISKKITDGTHHSPINTQEGEFMYVTAKNVKDNGVHLDDITYVTKSIHEEIYERCNPEKGDVLLIKDGATTGIVTVNNVDVPFSMLSSVALIKPIQFIDSWFVVFAMRSSWFYQYIRSEMTGVGITRVILKQIQSFTIPLPPLAEQKRIVAKLSALLPLCEKGK